MRAMARTPLDLDELVEFWTLLDGELQQLGAKRGSARLGFAILLKFYTRHGRFPRGRAEVADEAVGFVARQVGVAASELGFYGWSGRTIESHPAQIRHYLGFRECTVTDAEKLAEWLAAGVCRSERRPDQVRERLLTRCRAERLHPPAGGRVERIVRSAL
jgi:Transposase.